VVSLRFVTFSQIAVLCLMLVDLSSLSVSIFDSTVFLTTKRVQSYCVCMYLCMIYPSRSNDDGCGGWNRVVSLGGTDIAPLRLCWLQCMRETDNKQT